MGGCWQLVFACCLFVQNISAEGSVKDNSTSPVISDEELEKNIEQRIASLQKMGQDEIDKLADIALNHYNMQEASLFRSFRDATVTVKKAIGSIVYLRITLEKTNCTKKDVNPNSPFGFSSIDDSEKKEPPKYCAPLTLNDKEQLNCRFDIFKDERSYGEVVINYDCKLVNVIDKGYVKDDP